MAIVKCQSCGKETELKEGMKICPYCGASLFQQPTATNGHTTVYHKNNDSDLKRCRECGKPVANSADKCPNCGADHPTIGNFGHTLYLLVKIPLLLVQIVCGIALIYFVLKIFG